MIPNIQTGASFRGAHLYYLHDKRAKDELLRLSDERVAWTATRNTAHDAADDAFAEMIATARDQDQLKVMHGISLAGRPCEQPVMTISLAWHPSERPSKGQMIDAADSYVRHMAWDQHQAVYVAHTDTAHPHLHIILNRIHPETGRVLDDSFSKNRTQEWARTYEQEHGRIWCEERIGKDYTRANGKEPRSLPHDYAVDLREARYHGDPQLEEAASTLDARQRDQLARHHQDEREAFLESRHRQFRQAREAAYREVREDYKPRWVEHFREAAAARERAERDAAALALHVLNYARQGDFPGAWAAVADRDAIRRQVEEQIAEARRELSAEQRAETRERQDEACDALYEERVQAFVRLKHRQKEERGELGDLQAARADGRPYDEERLTELVTEPVVERLSDPAHHRDADRQPDKTAAEAERADESADSERSQEHASAEFQLPEKRSLDSEAQPNRSEGDGALVTGASDALAGGIGKLAEILADVIAGLICPETEQDRARRRAAAKAQQRAPPGGC